MSSALKYAMKRVVPFSYEETVEIIKSSLKEQGFGVLTEIDVKATLAHLFFAYRQIQTGWLCKS